MPLVLFGLWVFACFSLMARLETWLPLISVPVVFLIVPGFDLVLGNDAYKVKPSLVRLGILAAIVLRAIGLWAQWGVDVGGPFLTFLVGFVLLIPLALAGLIAAFSYGLNRTGWRTAYPLAACGLAIAAWFISFSDIIPVRGSESWMQENFWRHESQFTRLATMAQEDPWGKLLTLEEVRPQDFHWDDPLPPISMSMERWREYKDLFGQVGVTEGLVVRRGRVYFIYWSGTSSIYGYAYEGVPPPKSLDSDPRYMYRMLKKTPITDNWYLFSDYHDGLPTMWP